MYRMFFNSLVTFGGKNILLYSLSYMFIGVKFQCATYDHYVDKITEARNFEQLVEPINRLEELINRGKRMPVSLFFLSTKYCI